MISKRNNVYFLQYEVAWLTRESIVDKHTDVVKHKINWYTSLLFFQSELHRHR